MYTHVHIQVRLQKLKYILLLQQISLELKDNWSKILVLKWMIANYLGLFVFLSSDIQYEDAVDENISL